MKYMFSLEKEGKEIVKEQGEMDLEKLAKKIDRIIVKQK